MVAAKAKDANTDPSYKFAKTQLSDNLTVYNKRGMLKKLE